jgi:hypothetical protein
MAIAKENIGDCLCYTPSPAQLFQAQTGLVFSIRNSNGSCKVYVPNYTNIFPKKVPNSSGTEMVFKDEYTSQSVLVEGSTSKIDSITLTELWNYVNENVKWDSLTETLSFVDSEVEETTLYDFVKDIDSFLVYHKLTKFGNVWWVGRAKTDLEGDDSRNVNVTIPNTSGYGFGSGNVENQVKFWSPDKYINDEYKKYIKDPIFYTGFITSSDFSTNGWFSIPDLKLSTKPFEKLKIAQILLNINFVFDPKHLGEYYTIDSTIGSRIKDETSNTILDISQTKSNQNSGIFADTIINHWVGGLVSTENLQSLGPVGTFKETPCISAGNNTETNISHSIAAQISLNPNTDNNSKELLNTIDPINWKSSETEKNSHKIGILNEDRAFGRASGTADDATVFGGVQKSESQDATILDTIEIWSGMGFLTNVSTQANLPRSFHLQGGSGSKAAAVIGGYSKFNYNSVQQFSEYGKTNVLDDMEVFIRSDNPLISYFRKVPTIKLTTPRGDGAGTINVSVQDRKGKFDVQNELKTYTTSKEDEQMIAEFVDSYSGIGDSKRYTIMNIDGFVYGGSSTGNSYLINNSSGDILDSFERISVIYAGVGNGDYAKYDGDCKETVVDVLAIDCKEKEGRVITLKKCGKYRIRYLNGAGKAGS